MSLSTPRMIALLATAALAGACGGGNAPPGERARILMIEDRREPARSLLPFLDHPDASVRAAAARAAGRLGDRDAPDVLARLLADPDGAVRREAAFALGLVTTPPDVARRAAGLAAGALADAEPATRAHAIGSLGRLAGELSLAGEPGLAGEDVARAAALLADGDPRVVRAALLATWRLPEPVALERVVELGADQRDPVRWAAAYHLGRRLRGSARVGATPVPSGRPLTESEVRRVGGRLLDLADDPLADVRREAARGLGHVPGDEALRGLGALAGDPSWRVRVAAQRGLAAHGTPPAELVLRGLVDPSAHVRVAALEASARVVEPTVPMRQALVALLTDDPEGVRVAAHAAAARLLAADDYDALTADAGLMEAGGGGAGDATAEAVLRGRVTALGALRGLVRPGTAPPDSLLDLPAAGGSLLAGGDRAPRALGAAHELLWDALSARPGDPADVLPRLDELLPSADADVVVRASALAGLRGFLESAGDRVDADGRRIAGRALAGAYAAAANDTLHDARRASLETLADLELPGALPILERAAATDGDPWLARRAAELARDGGSLLEPRPYETGRDLADYESALTAGPLTARFETRRGEFIVELLVEEAPLTVDTFRRLASRGYFDGTPLHRVVPDFVVQGGDPRGDGWGGPGFTIRCEVNPVGYARGTMGMALAGKDTGGSQFFVTHSPQPHLDGGYTVFGRVAAGMDVVDRLLQGDRLVRVRVEPSGG